MNKSMFSVSFFKVVWRELSDCSNFSMWLWTNSRLEQSSFIPLLTRKSSFLLIDCNTLTSSSVVCRSHVPVDDVFFHLCGWGYPFCSSCSSNRWMSLGLLFHQACENMCWLLGAVWPWLICYLIWQRESPETQNVIVNGLFSVTGSSHDISLFVPS